MGRWPSYAQKQLTFARVGYEPNDAQRPIHQGTPDLLQVVGAEGAGKSRVTAEELTACFLWCELIYLVGQTYENTHREFDYMRDSLLQLNAVNQASISQPQRQAWRMLTRTGCEIVTLSVEKGAASIIAKGEEPDVIALVEAGRIRSYGVLLASVRRVSRSHGRVILSGTLVDDFGWYASLVDELTPTGNAWRGRTYSLPAWTNKTLYPLGREDPEIQRLEAVLPSDEFARTVAAERVPSRALVFPEFNYHEHVRDCPFDAALDVTLWIDPGYFPSAYCVLAVQFHGKEVWIIDEVYLHHHTHDQVIDVCKARAWWGKVTDAVIDYAGRQHQADRSAAEVWGALARIYPRSQQVGILDGISRHRTFLSGKGGKLYHDPGCTQALAEYKQYKRPQDLDGNPTSDVPIDANNHAMKAIAYGLVDRFGFVEHPRVRPARAGDPFAFVG